MKILDPNSATLINWEVHCFLAAEQERHEQQQQQQQGKKKPQPTTRPPNMEMVTKEVLQYLETPPSPLSQQRSDPGRSRYSKGAIKALLQKLQLYGLLESEVIMVLNLRPGSVAALNAVVDDMAGRYTDEEQEAMVQIVAEVLGGQEGREGEQGQEGGQGQEGEEGAVQKVVKLEGGEG